MRILSILSVALFQNIQSYPYIFKNWIINLKSNTTYCKPEELDWSVRLTILD
jgi:hypothetical protein